MTGKQRFGTSLVTAIITHLLLTPHSFALVQDEANLSCTRSPDNAPIPVAITLSGGVSLGAYQAGFLYYSGLVFSENPRLLEPKIITGASAGGLNTLLSVLSFCGREPASPTRSALWNAWLSLRAEDFVAKPEDPRALLSQKALLKISEDLERAWREGLPVSCDVVLGVSATRVSPAQVNNLSDLDFVRQEEKFSLRIQGRGPGKAPEVSNYINALAGGNQPLLALERGNDRQNFRAVRDLLLATSAFPFIFPPQKLRYCNVTDSGRWLHADYPLSCRPEEIEEAEFLDGGLLDNKPLGLAERLARTGLATAPSGLSRVGERCGSVTWKKIPAATSDGADAIAKTLFIYEDVGSFAYPDVSAVKNEKRVVPFMGAFLGRTFNSNRNKDSLVAIEQNPRLSSQIAPARNLYPRSGDHFIGFFGFFERDFRAFDFYLGMYEAREFFRSRVLPNLSRGGLKIGAQIKLPEQDRLKETDWRPLACLSGLFEGGAETSAPSECKAFESRNFLILAKLAQERLRLACVSDQKLAARPDSSCQRLSKAAFEFDPNEDDLHFTLRRLAELGFEYRDLGLKANEAPIAPAKIKSGALNAIEELASAQPIGEGFLVRAVAPVALNAIGRLPTEREAAVTLGTKLSISASWLQPSTSYPPRGRLVLAGQLENYAASLGTGSGSVVPSLLGGAEWDIGDVSSSAYQARLSLLTGYKFNSSVTLESDEILNGCRDLSASPGDCRGVVVQPGFSLTLIERLRLQLELETLPFTSGPTPWQFLPSVGVQLYF